ncbi:MAG TPA: TatD family hydrolase [Polyangia bacterium]|jgi:TatD DNase family protein|nr:TatD family hydrolase [Polyangia bacterium]
MIDSHCHLDFDEYGGDRAETLARARAAGITAMITIGSGRDLVSARAAVALAASEPDIFATVGIHPHDVARMAEDDWTELGSLARQPRVVGVGETGLDYHYDHSPRETQRLAYRRFVSLARSSNCPVVSHVRDAHADAVEILIGERAADVGGVIHCFTGDVADARRYLDIGHYLSFSGILTFKSAAPIREAAAFAPLDRILVETDAPYLAPIPYRGKRNEPSFMVKTLEALASVRGVSVAELDAATAENTRRVFKLPV